ncbi:DUF7718 family protein [Haloarcula laminariae]|uniref:DUF7718 family protein n=1 Tax=Haloarcula laminariae TaxID=2961577 RepID=UPI003D691276
MDLITVAEKDYIKSAGLSHLRLRFHLVTSDGEVSEFLIQLEYNHQLVDTGPDSWCAIARFDHNPQAPDGHDVTEEGLHLDLLNPDGSKYDVRRGFGPVLLGDCPTFCENYLLSRAEKLLINYEKRNDISDGLFRS